MATREQISYALFKDRIEVQWSKNAGRASEDKYDDLIENEQDYKVAVGKAVMKFKDEVFTKYARGMDRQWLDWITYLKSIFKKGRDGEQLWRTLATISSQKVRNLKSGGTRAELAYAIHYRLHCEFEHPEHAAEIDRQIWGKTFEGKFHYPVFEEIPDSELPASYPIHLKLDDSYQRGRPEFVEIKKALLSEERQDLGISIALQGFGGHGKTALAEEICLDEDVQEAFSGGIYWLQFGLVQIETEDRGRQKYTLSEAIQGMLARQYPPESKPTLNPQTDKTLLASFFEKLPDEPMLLIVDDLWASSQAGWLDFLTSNVSLLVTTRDRTIASQQKISLEVTSLAPGAAFNLLSHNLSNLNLTQKKRLRVASQAFKGWPLLLRLANATAQFRYQNGSDWDDILNEIETYAQLEDIEGWDTEEPGEEAFSKRRKLVGYSIEAGLAALPDDTARFAAISLAVFPDDADIPFPVCSGYWLEVSKKFSNRVRVIHSPRANSYREALFRLAFFREYDSKEKTFKLHDVLLSYFRNSFRKSEIQSLHAMFVTALSCSEDDELPRLDDDNSYGWKYLLYHLELAGQHNVAEKLRLDLSWMKSKLRITGPKSLLDSYPTIFASRECLVVREALLSSLGSIISRPEEFPLLLFGRLEGRRWGGLAKLQADLKADPDLWPLPRSRHLTLDLEDRKIPFSNYRYAEFRENGNLFVRARRSGFGEILSTSERKLVANFDFSHLSFLGFWISGSGRYAWISAYDDGLFVWDLFLNKPVPVDFEFESWVINVSFSETTNEVSVQEMDGRVILFDCISGEPCERSMWHIEEVEPHRFFGDTLVAYNSAEASLEDVISGQPIFTLPESERRNRGEVYKVLPYENLVTIFYKGELTQVWDLATETLLCQFNTDYYAACKSGFNGRLAFDDNKARVAAVLSCSSVDILDFTSGATLGRISFDFWVEAVHWKGETLRIGCRDGEFYEFFTGRC
ncbi:MAG: NB-ARC domain-containing protein [Cognatishimia sp.]